MSINQRTAIASIIRAWNLGILTADEVAAQIKQTYIIGE